MSFERTPYDYEMLRNYNQSGSFNAAPWPTPRTAYDQALQHKWCPTCDHSMPPHPSPPHPSPPHPTPRPHPHIIPGPYGYQPNWNSHSMVENYNTFNSVQLCDPKEPVCQTGSNKYCLIFDNGKVDSQLCNNNMGGPDCVTGGVYGYNPPGKEPDMGICNNRYGSHSMVENYNTFNSVQLCDPKEPICQTGSNKYCLIFDNGKVDSQLCNNNMGGPDCVTGGVYGYNPPGKEPDMGICNNRYG